VYIIVTIAIGSFYLI